jgi:hypothetical protein
MKGAAMNKDVLPPKEEILRNSKNLLNSAIKSSTTASIFAFSCPDDINAIIKRMQEGLTHDKSERTPLEYILSRFEKDAQKLLEKPGYATTIYSKPLHALKFCKCGHLIFEDTVNLDIKTLNAKQVLLSAKLLREAIKKKQAEKAALEMLKLFSAAICADLYETIMQGAHTKRGQEKRKPSRAAIAIKEAIKDILKEHPNHNHKQLWNYFKINHKGLERAFKATLNNRKHDVYYSDDINEIMEIQYHPIYQGEIVSNKNIGIDRFKKYFHEIKKLAS